MKRQEQEDEEDEEEGGEDGKLVLAQFFFLSIDHLTPHNCLKKIEM